MFKRLNLGAKHQTPGESSVFDSSTNFAAEAYKIEGVQAVYFKTGADSINHLWTLVKRDEYELRERVYEAETQMYSEYPDESFDFYVVTANRLRKNLRKTIPADFTLITRRDAHAIGRRLPRESRA